MASLPLMPGFDLWHHAFSRCGAYLSLRVFVKKTWAPAGDGLYLRTNRSRGAAKREIFRIDVLRNGRPIAYTAEASPDCLRLLPVTPARGGGRGRVLRDSPRVEFCFAAPDCLRIRAAGGLSLGFHDASQSRLAHPAEGGRWIFNARQSMMRLMLEPLAGRLDVSAPWAPGQCPAVEIAMHPDADGRLDLAIDEFQSTWLPRARPPFDDCRADAADDFAGFLDHLPSAPRSLQAPRTLAAFVDWSCIVRPGGLFRRPAMLMSKNWMDNVWSWDHAFNAMALAYRNPALAFDQMMLEGDMQDEFGCFPDSTNNMVYHYNFCKPPIHGWAFRFLRLRNRRFFDKRIIAKWHPVLNAWTDWWLNHRRWEHDTLCYYLHGNDSGWDNSTLFDRGVPLVAPDLAAFLILQLDELADEADILGHRRHAAQRRRQAAEMRDALLARLWHEGEFTAIVRPANQRVHCDSLIPCVPLVLGRRLPADVAKTTVRRLRRFLTPHGLATEDPASPHYSPDGYWRGPIWAPSTMLIVSGLADLGQTALVRQIARRFCRTCAASGMAENFNALTGAPLRDQAYTWTASTFLVLAHEYLQ